MGKPHDQRLETGGRLSGTFEVEPGRNVFGELSVDRKESLLYLRDDDFFHTHDLAEGYLKGKAHDLSCISLFDCITVSGPGSGGYGSESYTFAEVFPHHVVHGSTHIGPTEEAISAVIFSVDDGRALFYDFDSFGTVLNARRLIRKVATANSRVTKRTPAFGPYPAIYYFTGRRDLLGVNTAIGRVQVSNLTDKRFGSPKRFELSSRVGFKIGFDQPVDLWTAQNRAAILTRFLELLIGRPQNQDDLTLRINSDRETPTFLKSYSTMRDELVHRKDRRRPGPRDVLIEGVSNRREMAKVMRKWLALDQDRRDARLRFSHCFRMDDYFTEDRLIGAANMFDLLPETAVPKRTRLLKKVTTARDQARELFEKLDDSPERHSVLSALGRLGSSSLPRKIMHRARIVIKRIPSLEPDMELVIRQAVICRNHYVHGSPGGFDYRAHSGAIPFFTRALEFIFGASELIECGWDIGESGGGDQHPFAMLLYSWTSDVADIKAAINTSKSST